MSQWVWSGLRWGVRTTRYPACAEEAPGVSPGLPAGRTLRIGPPRSGAGTSPPDEETIGRVAERCPTGALLRHEHRIDVDRRRCVHCFRCARAGEDSMPWGQGYEWTAAIISHSAHPQATGSGSPSTEPAGSEAAATDESPVRRLGRAFTRSVHIRVVDAGDCGACLHEIKQLTNPYYNLHRLGLFFTPTPRQADILLVVGPGADQMRTALKKTYAAMPPPRRVIAVGACALSGGVFGPSFACSDGVGSIVPVDFEVPGNPPPPLAILHALLVATGREEPARWVARADARASGASDLDARERGA